MSTNADNPNFRKPTHIPNLLEEQSIEQKEKKIKRYMEELLRGSDYIRPSKPNFNPTQKETESPQKDNQKGAWAEVLERPNLEDNYPKATKNFKKNKNYHYDDEEESLEDLDEIEDELPNSSQF